MGNISSKFRWTPRYATTGTQTEPYTVVKEDLVNINCLEINDANIDFLGMHGYARVDLIYDGDTATFVFWHGGLNRFVRVRVRMAHYDAPEIKGGTEIEKDMAISAREEFERLVQFKGGSGRRVKRNRTDSESDIVWFEVTGMDTKWHRPVVMVWNTLHPERSINAIIHEKWGVDYEGKTKAHVWGDERVVNITYDRPLDI